MIAPVYHLISADPQYEQIVLGLTTAKITLEKEGIPFISYKDLLGDNKKAETYGRMLASDHVQHPDVSVDETIAYLGLNFYDLVMQFGEEKAFQLYSEKGRAAFLPIETMEKLINRFNPDIIVATNSPRTEKAALKTARKLCKPSLCLVDIFSLEAIKGQLSEPEYGTKICVLNQYTKEKLIEFGRPASEVEVTGNPAFDKLSENAILLEADEYKKQKKLNSKKVILWARSALPEDIKLADDIEKSLIQLTLANTNYALILRPHPNEPKRLVPDADNIIYSDRYDNLAVVLHASDIVCTLYSTVGIEGAIINKKVIQITSTESFKSVDFVAAGLAQGAKNLDELETLIHNFDVQMTNEKKEIRAGNAAENVKTVLVKLIEETLTIQL